MVGGGPVWSSLVRYFWRAEVGGDWQVTDLPHSLIAECGMRNVDCGLRSAECGVRIGRRSAGFIFLLLLIFAVALTRPPRPVMVISYL